MIDTSIPALLSHFSATEATVPLINPANGKRITDVPQQSAETVVAAIDRLRDHAAEWAATDVRERAAIISRVHDVMLENQDKLLDVLQLETGKSRAHAFEEFAGTTAPARYYGKHAAKFMARKKTGGGVPVVTRTWVEHDPIGVVGIITPWNYPMALTALDVCQPWPPAMS